MGADFFEEMNRKGLTLVRGSYMLDPFSGNWFESRDDDRSRQKRTESEGREFRKDKN